MLARVALEVGLPEDEVRDLLASDRYAAEVRDDERTAMSLGINAVPVLRRRSPDRRRGRPPPEALGELLRRGWEARAAADVPGGRPKSVAAEERVCPHCGEPAGRRLLRLVRAQPRRGRTAPDPGGVGDHDRRRRPAAGRPLRRGDRGLPRRDARGRRPGATKTAMAGSGWRRRHVEGWVVRAVERDENLRPSATSRASSSPSTAPSISSTTRSAATGRATSPAYEHTVGAEPVD